MSPFLLLFVLAISVSAFHSDESEITFEPIVPSVYLHGVHGANVSSLPHDLHHINDPEALALAFVDQFVSPATYLVKNSYVTQDAGIRHVYCRQTANDLEIVNADLNINVWRREVMSIGSSFYNGTIPKFTLPELRSDIALLHLAKYLGQSFELSELEVIDRTEGIENKHLIRGYPSAISDVKARLAYIQVDIGQRLELVWDFEIDVLDHWWNAFVSTSSGQVIALFDWVNHQSEIHTYNAYPIGVNDPDDGARRVHRQPAKSMPSPSGWHDQGEGRTFTDTRGNNVFAQENWSGGSGWINNQRPSSDTYDFDYEINFDSEPEEYWQAAVANLFYWNNIIHDVFYYYGFDEPSGNFQENNWGRGGLGNDAVQANCQDGSGYNNANFATPPDGQRPRMRMYVWNRSSPMRDGDLDSGIIIHEYGHGISTRLTGGPANSNCLSGGEAGGMGEGWGDFWATALRQRASYRSDHRFPMGNYDNNNVGGIRKFPYTTDMTINPETYSYTRRAGYEGVHAKGEVWCGILWEVYWALVDDFGFVEDWYQGEGGNTIIFRLVVHGLKLQPCRPTFIQARDAILQADRVNYDSKHTCRIWKAVAKRGLGVNAVAGTDSFDVPSGCEGF